MGNIKECNEFEKLIDYLQLNRIDFKYITTLGKSNAIRIIDCNCMTVVYYDSTPSFADDYLDVYATAFDNVVNHLNCDQVINIVNNYSKLQELYEDCNKELKSTVKKYENSVKDICNFAPHKSL